jgi:ABC-type Fe3+-hydroxamate transport system substrate-binding protein
MNRSLAFALFLSGCATTGSSTSATLLFTGQDRMGLPGGIVQIDSRPNPPEKRVLEVAPGRRTVTYHCPDVVTVDSPPKITATFEAGRTYELVCTGTEAVIRER